MPDSPARTVELSCVVAWTAWTVSVLLFIVGVALAMTQAQLGSAMSVLTASILSCGAAVVASISVMLRRHYGHMRNAFNLGRDAGRLEAMPIQRVH